MHKTLFVVVVYNDIFNWLLHVAAAYLAGVGDIGGTTECFNRENPINSGNWAKVLAALTVIVMTAQSFLNVLKDNAASLHDIALMVSYTLYKVVKKVIANAQSHITCQPLSVILHNK